MTFARSALPLGSLIFPHQYEVTDSDGNHIGAIAGQISLRDTYNISIDDATGVPREAIVAAAMVIDAIQNQ